MKDRHLHKNSAKIQKKLEYIDFLLQFKVLKNTQNNRECDELMKKNQNAYTLLTQNGNIKSNFYTKLCIIFNKVIKCGSLVL